LHAIEQKRIQPEDVIINIGQEAQAPPPPPGHKWKRVIHNKYVSWLAGWKDSINTKDWKCVTRVGPVDASATTAVLRGCICRYVQLAATSTIKGESDMAKFEKARALKKCIDVIRKDYKKNMQSSDVGEAQLAVTTYLVDKLALRAGGEKDDDLADTVGVCTLRVRIAHMVQQQRTLTPLCNAVSYAHAGRPRDSPAT
jgi:DNA topoisomerase-1